jgi:hypothetical protein
MTPDEQREERLARLIGASRAEANPAVLARARARIAARAGAPGVALWLGRPAVLAGCGALFVLCLAGSFVLSRQLAASTAVTPATADGGLISSLLGDEDLGLPIATSDANGSAAGDSGEVTP